jgi:ribosomal protein S19E (S16A)
VGENCAFIETSNGAVGIRTLRHIYGIRKERTPDARTSVVTDERFMFFDVVDDPYEMENLVHTEADGEVASRLRRRVLEWDAQTPWKR